MKLWNLTLTTREIVILLKFIQFMGRLKMVGQELAIQMEIEESEILTLKNKLDRTPLAGQEVGEVPD